MAVLPDQSTGVVGRMSRLFAFAIISAIAVLSPPQSFADDTIGIRCFGYEESTVLLSGEVVGHHIVKDEPFDVYISPSRGTGWWEGDSMALVNEEHPATLTTDRTMYELTAKRTTGFAITEWLHLDRLTGTMGLYSRNPGQPTQTHKRGGTCSKMEPKF
jgi:hypothetical protein